MPDTSTMVAAANTVIACLALSIAIRAEFRTRRQELAQRLAARERATVGVKRVLDAADNIPVRSAKDLPALLQVEGRKSLQLLVDRAEEAITEGRDRFAEDAVASKAESSKAILLAAISARASSLLGIQPELDNANTETKLLRELRDLFLDVKSLIDPSLRSERTLDGRKRIADQGFMSPTIVGELRRRIYQLHSDSLKGERQHKP